jgi:hypothetical protein
MGGAGRGLYSLVPQSFNGFGTTYYGGAAPIYWQKPETSAIPADHDAVECVIALLLPVFPLRSFHTFQWQLRECKIIPIKRRPVLVLRALLRPYLTIAAMVSGFMSLVVLSSFLYAIFFLRRPLNDLLPRKEGWELVILAWGSFVLTQGFFALLNYPYIRSRDVRLIIGPYELGSSDPATWDFVPSATESEGVSVDAAHHALTEGQFSRAMYCARVLVALGDRRGQSITDKILGDRRVRSKLPALRRRPWLREQLFPEDRSLRVEFARARWAASGRALRSEIKAKSHH